MDEPGMARMKCTECSAITDEGQIGSRSTRVKLARHGQLASIQLRQFSAWDVPGIVGRRSTYQSHQGSICGQDLTNMRVCVCTLHTAQTRETARATRSRSSAGQLSDAVKRTINKFFKTIFLAQHNLQQRTVALTGRAALQSCRLYFLPPWESARCHEKNI